MQEWKWFWTHSLTQDFFLIFSNEVLKTQKLFLKNWTACRFEIPLRNQLCFCHTVEGELTLHIICSCWSKIRRSRIYTATNFGLLTAKFEEITIFKCIYSWGWSFRSKDISEQNCFENFFVVFGEHEIYSYIYILNTHNAQNPN